MAPNRKKIVYLSVLVLLTLMVIFTCSHFTFLNAQEKKAEEPSKLLVVWGPSSKLLAEDKELQDYLKKMKNAGVEIQACIACANMYGVTERLRELGIEVKGMGVPLTEMLKTGWTTMTF